MPLSLVTHIELPAHKSSGGFDHADIYAPTDRLFMPPTDRLYVAHTSNDAIDVIDCARMVCASELSPGPAGARDRLKCPNVGEFVRGRHGRRLLSFE
jgi:hypothetical protein